MKKLVVIRNVGGVKVETLVLTRSRRGVKPGAGVRVFRSLPLARKAGPGL